MKVMKIAATAALALGVMTACTSNDSAAPATVTVTASSSPSTTSSTASSETTKEPVEKEVDCSDLSLSQSEWMEAGCNEVPQELATPKNPVELAKKITGCDVGDAESGDTDINGNRFTECYDPDGNVISVHTYAGHPDNYNIEGPRYSDDSITYIMGEDFLISIATVGRYTGNDIIAMVGSGEVVPRMS